RLDDDRLRALRARIRDDLRIARIHEREFEAEVAVHLVEQAIRAAVDVLAADDVIAALEELHERIDARDAARERDAVACAFERRYVALQGLPRGVLRPRILVALVFSDPLLHVRRREIDGGHDGAGHDVGALSSVDGARAEAAREIVVEYPGHARQEGKSMR